MKSARSFAAAAIVGVGILIAPAIARAADMAVPLTKPEATDWTGFYFGINAGYGWGTRSMTYTANDGATALLFSVGGLFGGNSAPSAASFGSSGAIGGLQVGYNWQLNNQWLVGVEADFDWSAMKGSASGNGNRFTPPFLPVSDNVDEKIKWFGTVRGRLGYLPANNLLAYVTGGLAYGKVEHTASYTNNGALFALGPSLSDPFNTALCSANATCFAGSSSSVVSGWTAGAGFEYAFWGKFSLKAEYLYVSLQGVPVRVTAARSVNGSPEVPATYQADFGRTTFNVARVGLNYRF
ncbi:outer membrane protein [Leptospira sp. severe_002]|uniref:outer membrane protein n=1 Tax=Leptospira sp. severe_002 TaxID=2838237 RepID=UPI001E62AFF6|nr:outer membrane beta-barrel protein [Leptospira sp. severe_002]